MNLTFAGDRNTKICGTAKLFCCTWAEMEFFEIDKPNGTEYHTIEAFRNACKCLPACTAIEYEGNVDRVKYNWKAIMPHLFDGNRSISRLTVTFYDHQVENVKRLEVQTYTNFLAICGGLLGLFLGVSVLSIVEFVYFFTLRLFWTIQRTKSENVISPAPRRRFNRSIFVDMMQNE